MDQFQSFAQTPQGQQALLAFANSSLQNSMNPMMGGGAGFIGAMGSGMQGYKAADEAQSRKARQKKEEEQEDTLFPLKVAHLKGQIEGQGRVETAHKLNEIIKHPYPGPNGRVMIQEYVVKSITKDGEEITEPKGKPYPRSEPVQGPQPSKPHAMNPMMVSWFQSPAGGSRKDIRTYEDLAKLTPEQSAAFYEVIKKTPAMQGGLMAFLLGDQGQQQGQGYTVPEEDLK
jgi:hypothetical protein